MAAKQRYYPGKEPAQVTWLTNYRNKISIHGPACGLTAAEITDIIADIDYLIFLLNVWHPSLQGDVKEGTDYKELIETGSGVTVPLPLATTFTPPAVRPPGVLTRLFNQVQRVKLAAGYTTPIGEDLGIIGAADSTERPFSEFTLTVVDGENYEEVVIRFKKFGHQGAWIESRRNNGPWEFLAIDTSSPNTDTRPLLVSGQAETREYRLRWYDDGPNGDWSPVQKVTVGA